MPQTRDLAGQRFGRLVAIEAHSRTATRQTRWLFRCDCGKEKVIVGVSVTTGKVRSCGCLLSETSRARAIVRNVTGVARFTGVRRPPRVRTRPPAAPALPLLHPPTLEERFWSKVEKRGPAECWPWQRATRFYGYGAFGVGARVVPASRMAYRLTHGSVPRGLQVLHHCDNPPCCNPAHLYAGTVTDNVHDMLERNRHVNAYGKTKGRLAKRQHLPPPSGSRDGHGQEA